MYFILNKVIIKKKKVARIALNIQRYTVIEVLKGDIWNGLALEKGIRRPLLGKRLDKNEQKGKIW